MAPFTDISPLLCLLYVLGGPAMLVALLALVVATRPNRRWPHALAVLGLAPVLVASLVVHALMWSATDHAREGALAGIPSLCALAGLAALSVLLALAALVWPRRILRVAGLLALIATVVASAVLVASARALIVDMFFWQDGVTQVRIATDQAPQRLALPISRESDALYLAAVAVVVATPLLAAAGLRARRREDPRRGQALVFAALALPPVLLGQAIVVVVVASHRPCNCLPSGPIDRTPDIVEMWTIETEQRILLLAAGLVALAIGSLGAVRLARAGVVAGTRTQLAAFAVFVVGGAAYLYTRGHASDLADGPRRAFTGLPFKPFGEVAADWTYPYVVHPPTAPTCTPIHADPTAALVIAADGETIVEPDELDAHPRDPAAWERTLLHALEMERTLAENTGREQPTPTVVAVIDRAAPIPRVRRYLQIAALHDIDEVLLVTRHADIAATRTLGDVRIDKLCKLGVVRLHAGLGFLDGHATWGEFVRATR